MIKIDLQQSSRPWHEYRSTKIGGSDIPSICKVDGAYKKYDELLHEKITGTKKETSDYAKALFQSGHEWEAIVNEKLKSNGYSFKPAIIQDELCDFYLASLDGLNEEIKETLEIKSTKSEKLFNAAKESKIPDVWNYQIQWGLYCTGYNKGLLAVVHVETGELILNEVMRDEKIISHCLQEAEIFLKKMQSGISPIQSVSSVTCDDENLKYIAESKKVVSEYQKLIDAEEDKIKKLSEDLLKKYNANCIIGHNVKIEFSERKGNVDYSAIPELKGVSLEKYRKPASRFIKITIQKQKQIEGND